MRTLNLILPALILTLSGSTALASAPKEPPIYVTRHYDTPAGERDPDLLRTGKARAEALAKWFKGKKLKVIYVSDYQRTRQTAAPLAAAKGITVETYDAKDTPAIVARAKSANGPVLIVGHSNTAPDIVQQLGGTRPADLKHEDFGDIWTIRGGKSLRGKIEP